MAQDKISKNGWVRLAEVRSSSNPSKWYVVAQRTLNNGQIQIGCDCPGWKFGKKEATKLQGCKHVKGFLAGTIPQHSIQMTPTGTAILFALAKNSKKASA